MERIDAKRLLGGYSFHLTSPSTLAFALSATNTAVLSAGPAPLTLTVSAPADYAGTYPLDPTALGDGPVPLRPPEVVGSPTAGAPLEARPALWCFDGAALPPARGWQWQQDGVDIPGATSQVFTPGAEMAGSLLRVVETALGAGGLGTAASAAVPVPL